MPDPHGLDDGEPGRWRVRVSHWHLRAPDEWSDNDRERFLPARIEFERSEWTGGIAYTPRQVLMWFEATRERLIRVHAITPALLDAAGFGTEADRAEMRDTEKRFALAGSDVRGSLDIAGSRVVTWAAYGMHPIRCTVSHADIPAVTTVR